MIRPPRGAVDTHVHVFDPGRFPFAADAGYHPMSAEVGTAADLAMVLDAAGIERVVLVNPTSGYGTDNRCMLDAIERLGARARGIARVPLDCSGRSLDALARHGVVGVRIDFMGTGATAISDRALSRLLVRLCDRDMVCTMQGEGGQWLAIAPIVAKAPTRVVIDHCGRPDVSMGLNAPAFTAVLRLADTGRVAVKLSGPMRFSAAGPPYRDTDAFFAAAARAFTAQALMWGSDWPFLRSDGRVDYGPSFAHLVHILPKPADQRAALADTPARWFRFLPDRSR
jgi:predicted TIM-barrel fold metal-dependent hydrolase